MPKQEQAKSAPVCLIVGANEFSATQAARDKIDRFVPPADQTLGLEIIDGQADVIEQALACLRGCLEAVRTIGFMGGRKVVWMRAANFLGNPIICRNKEVQETLQILADTITGGIPDGHFLVITAPKLDKRTAFYKACIAAGELIEFDLAEKPWQREQGAVTFAMHAFKDAGLQIGGVLIEFFVRKVGTDTRQIMQEIAKLTTYLGGRREVQSADIEAITASSRDIFAWDLGDAAGMRDLPRAMTVLRQLLFQHEAPIGLISVLEGRFRQLLLFRDALDNRWITLQPLGHANFKLTLADLPETTMEQVKAVMATEKGTPLHPFVAGKLAGQAMLFSRPEIEERRDCLLAARRQMVSSATPEALILEYLVLKICRPRARRMQK